MGSYQEKNEAALSSHDIFSLIFGGRCIKPEKILIGR